MDAKDLRTESALSERNNDGSKYSQSGGIALHCDRNKSYQDIGSNSLAKVDVQTARPCAVIGPDRIVPPPAPSEAYLKKGSIETWPCMDNAYHTRRPPEYPHKLANFQNPTRNISPRQTFQENMQRIMVPPSYNSVKISDDTNYVQMSDRSNTLPKNIKINMPPEAKFCDVPYTVYPTSNEQKNVRNPEMCISSVNPTLTRTAPHGWPSGSVNIRPTRTYGAPELYQYQEYPSCAGPRPVVPRPNRTVQEESGYVYGDPFYHQEGNIRFKPYPTVKDRFPQQRYEYIGNYANSFHPPPAFPSHKYELQKAVPPHPYPPYPPIKYLDRVPEPVMEGYQRNQQGSYNIPYRNQIIHPNYGPVLGNCPQNKIHSYPPDAHIKTVAPNKLPFDNVKTYIEYENGRPKMYPPSESYLVNEMGRMHPMKSQVIMPNYPTLNVHNMPPNPYYKKDNQQMKNYEYIQAHFRSMDPNLNIHNPMVRHQPVFSPNTSAISPTDSSASNDTSQNLGTSQEDCGYVSQSSTASVRSMDSGINRIPNDCLRKYYDSRFGPIIRTAPLMSKSELNSSNNSKEKRNIDVRQFFQMWNEGDEETEENNAKEVIIQSGPKCDNNFSKVHEVISQSNQEQLYVLGLVNVPSEELGKYEHIQKVSKLPENIKGYNHIELLNQFEEAIESSNMTNYKTSAPKDFQMPSKVVSSKQATCVVPPRPLSPLDVEAKISQSVIHKEVGCNFEIKPCSPKMMNVEVATPVQNILAERAIEKVANPVMLKSPRLNGIDENIDCNIMKRKDHRMNISNESVRIPSCKMANTQFSNNNSIDSIKNSYSLQDLESNSGLCLASLPRLDNDIELNFPEVNQQFINANKGDTSVSTSLRDLPSLELLEHLDNPSKDKLNDINSLTQASDVLKSPCIVDSEKEFSKLSKYRKSKPHLLNPKENQTHHVINAARTDSVIIKNPENAKNHGEKSIFSPTCLSKQDGDIQQVPINLTSQGCITENIENTPTIIETHDASKEKDTTVEIAIDFSLNKNTSEKIECIEIKNDKEIEILTHNTIEANHPILDDHLSKLPTFSDCDQNNHHNFIDNNKIEEASIPSPIKCNDLETVRQTIDDENTRSIQSPPHREILTTEECLSPVSTGKEAKEVDDSTLSVAHVDEINYVSSNSLLPIEFGTPAAELIPTADSDSYLIDIDKNNDIVDLHSDKASYSLMQKDTDDNNDLNNHNNTDLRDVHIDAVSNPEAMNRYIKGCSEDAEAKHVINSELNIDVPKENLNQITNSTLVKDPRNINFDLPNNHILDHDTYKLESDRSSPNNIAIHSPDYQKEATNREIEFGLPSPNNIVTRSPDDYRKETIDREIEFNLPSPDNIVMRSPDDYRKETIERENKFNLPSPSNIVTRSPDDFRKDTTDRENEFNLPSPNNIVTRSPVSENEFNLASPKNIEVHSTNDYQCKDDCQTGNNDHENEINVHSLNNIETRSPNDYQCKVTERETDSDFNSSSPNNTATHSSDCQSELVQGETDPPSELPSLSSIDTHTRENDPSEMAEQETDFNLPPPNNMVTHNSNDCQSEGTEQETDSDFDLPVGNNIPTHGPIDYQSEFSNRETDSNSELISTNNVMAHKTNDVIKNKNTTDLLTEVLDNQIDLSSTEDKQCEDIEFLNVEGKKLEITRAIRMTPESVDEKKENINLEIRYLSYGSKEMYSPWIQKLIMFCEGSTNNVNMNKGTVVGNGCSIEKTEIEHMEISYDLDHCLEGEIENVSNQKMNSNNDCTTPAVESEAITSGNVSAMEEYTKIDNDNFYNEKCKNTEEEFDNVIEPAELHNTNTLQENDKLNIPTVCSHSAIDIKSKLDESTTMSSIVHDIGNPCGNLETLNVERATCCLSPDVHEQWDKQSNCSDKAHEHWNKPSNDYYDEVPNLLDIQSNCSDEVPEESNCIDEIPELWDKKSSCVDEVPERWDKQSNCNDEITEQWDKQSNCSDGVPDGRSKQPICKDEDPKQWDGQSICNDEAPKQQLDNQSTCNNELPKQWDKQLDCNVEDFEQWDTQSDCNDEVPEQSNVPPNCNYIEPESTTIADNDGNGKIQSNEYNFMNKKRLPLKRSLSDSALNMYNNYEKSQQENEENVPFIWPFKRRKMNNIQNDILAQNLCNIIQHNRRNSISAIYNEENVSFCILIDNGCIIAEEETEEPEKICYTELSEECLAEIQNDCTKDDESMAEVISTPQQDIDCEYSDSFVMQGEDEKVDESWVEDVACVETVISDDIAEDIEISGPSSPKDDVLSDNDESGVFSSSEHTDKVKYIYGDKMCNDDAQFVETLYNTPQMNVNKTLVQRETLISGEYYDNDSLERILSESNDQEFSPYVPEYTEPVFSPGIIDVKETVENKENMDKDMSYPLQSNENPLDVVVDTGVNKIDQGNVKLIPFDETQDDTIHSCESSIDNVFTYKENDENTNYTTSSSPEVSSTTSEEKNSGILLKITNYKGSRISQINDINRDSKRPSCKFTEDKDYVQSHSNFPTHRPLLTKAAQKYIPPLKESMRDLKVKLSLPQHSLMKLKQLKISKVEPKVCKQNIPVPRVSKKPKPKFEDVLKSIDEIQIKMHKEKSKKSKKCIPKVVIKKNENGSHYASTSNKDEFNPDLTGRKWQPWVFIEKNHFIDKMAIKKKTKAIYNHRKRTYVLAEKFQKYKSVNSAKFVISPPISDCPSTGLKYTIRLKHNY